MEQVSRQIRHDPDIPNHPKGRANPMKNHFGGLFLIMCLLLRVTSAFGQDDSVSSEDALVRSYNTVDSVTLDQTDEGLQLIIRSTLADGCDFPVEVDASRQGTIWFIDIYRDVPLDVMCPMMVQSDESTLDASILNELDDDDTLIDLIVINERVYHIERAQIEPVGNADTPPPLLTPWYQMPISITRMQTEVDDSALPLHLFWVPINGCEGQLVARVRHIPQSTGDLKPYDVIAYLAVPTDPTLTDCPALPMLVSPNEEIFQVKHNPLQAAIFQSEAMTLRYLPQFEDGVPQTDEWARSTVTVDEPEQIQSQILESFPPQISLNVTWEENATCADSYYEVLQGDNGSYITLKITQVVPADAECSQSISTQTMDFSLGTYPEGPVRIDVNGEKIEVDF
ncbi:hypothetical protein G4Y79_22645 [Phototrophicus methaneseepsis]|uniref:Uncharacterized protein n=1 Tax=Phototrophicus methaneseepsis TaxID=2710758 RepID=A0A7S8E8R4_9CHLR|nr:hypothetical protein [Phototrophicus methaneseepsis]QPC82451.1 hypothetical protein G4Y79_22645 [Phototrophicus methaneseepsis]